MRLRLSLSLLAILMSACTCQRQENVEAKARMSQPPPPEAHLIAAGEKIDAEALETPEVLKRVSKMEGSEVAARLKSFAFSSTGELEMIREGGVQALRSAERTRVQQDDNGDFAVEVVTGDGSEMRLAYVNDVFFLKNNNGKWRMSRDPAGERNMHRTDAMGIWRAFFELYEHALKIEKLGSGRHGGRDVVKYRLAVPDQSNDARSEGAALPPPPATVGPDGGVLDEPAPEKRKRLRDRMAKWRTRAKPAGGNGELWVDTETAVPLLVKFDGRLVVGDQPDVARLHVKIDQSITDVGKDQKVPMPKDAIEEIVRKKMPVRPRELLEEEGVVAPLPKDGGPSTSGPGSKKPAKAGEIPDAPADDDG